MMPVVSAIWPTQAADITPPMQVNPTSPPVEPAQLT
jgi:hypothetical protein